jgi:hypothetical protein
LENGANFMKKTFLILINWMWLGVNWTRIKKVYSFYIQKHRFHQDVMT